jgi:hypothetical protein
MVIKAAYDSLAQGAWVSVPISAEVKPLMRARA